MQRKRDTNAQINVATYDNITGVVDKIGSKEVSGGSTDNSDQNQAQITGRMIR